jgi:4-hydroxybenzoate polyprenyltransferase
MPKKSFARAARVAVLAMRVQQWTKNLLIFVPAITAHQVFNADVFPRVFLGFFSFSVCASAGYLINDLLDLKGDRKHPAKRSRPLASGALSPRFGAALAALLALTSFGFGNLVTPRYVLFLCGYLVLTITYSLALKSMLLVDIFLLAFFYTFRILLGCEAAGAPVSFWLSAFSTFFFFSLAAMKRFIELRLLANSDAAASGRRGYRAEDQAMLGAWGAASGCASIVVLALYIDSADVTRLYRHPAFLWPICLAMLFWLCRVWMLANRNELPYDPILFAIRDWRSYIVAALAALAFYLAL